MKYWAEKIYKSKVWQVTREAFLKSKLFICERCGEPATIAHHIVWLTRFNVHILELVYGWDNLEALCQDCHNKEHHKQEREKRYEFDSDGNMIPPIHERENHIL